MSSTPTQPPGWYYAQGDPPGTQRYWDGQAWQGGPQPVPGGAADPGVNAAAGLADAGARVGARVIDGVIWLIISLVVGIPFLGGSIDAVVSGDTSSISYASVALSGVLGALAVGAYEAFMVGSRGATFGKMALNLRVVNEDGSAPTLATGVRRIALYVALTIIGPLAGNDGLAQLLDILVFLIALAGLAMLFVDDKKQTPWDKIGKTLVVRD